MRGNINQELKVEGKFKITFMYGNVLKTVLNDFSERNDLKPKAAYL